MSISVTAVAASRAARVQIVPLSFGGEAWLVEDYSVPIIALQCAFAGGAAQDAPAQAGLGWLLGHLMDEGAGDHDAAAFHRLMEDKAIELSFSADRDAMTAHLRSLAKHGDAAFDLLGLALAKPRCDLEAIERLRSQILATLKREANDPDAVASRVFREAAYPDHPYGLSLRGAPESLAVIGRSDLLARHGAVFARDQVRIAAVGAIDARTLAERLEAIFAALPAQSRLRPVADVVMSGAGQVKIAPLDLPQTTIRFGVPGIGFGDRDEFAAVVVNHVLGGGVFTARLFREVREKRGLAYSIYTSLVDQSHAASLLGATATQNERAAQSLQVIREQIADLCENGPSEAELLAAKQYLIGSYDLRFDTSSKIAGQLTQIQREGRGVGHLDARNGLIEAVTREDAHRVARRLFADKPLLVAAAGAPVNLS